MTDMRALAKFLYEHCGLNPDQAGDVATTILSEYEVRPNDYQPQEARDGIARILDHEAFATANWERPDTQFRQTQAFAKADAIIALSRYQPQCAREPVTEEAINALQALARLPIERCPPTATDDWVLFEFNGHQITVGHVNDARAALTSHNGTAREKPHAINDAIAGPGAEVGREAIARKVAAWMGYSFDGLPDYSVVNRSFPEWPSERRYQGGQSDLLRLADALMAHTRPELGREITDEMIERGARAHCPWAFEGASTEGRNIARAEASKEVREILTAALSVLRSHKEPLFQTDTGGRAVTERDRIARRILYASGMFDNPAEIAANADHKVVREAYAKADWQLSCTCGGDADQPADTGNCPMTEKAQP